MTVDDKICARQTRDVLIDLVAQIKETNQLLKKLTEGQNAAVQKPAGTRPTGGTK